jgi:hypothetical protein
MAVLPIWLVVLALVLAFLVLAAAAAGAVLWVQARARGGA